MFTANVCFAAACFILIRKHAHYALFCLLSHTVCSLMAQEKQMSASQPLAFLLRQLYHDYVEIGI
jgi:hypothetical protein